MTYTAESLETDHQVSRNQTKSRTKNAPKSASKNAIHTPITEAEYSGLQQAYEFMNKALFGGELPNVMITLQRKANSKGYFGADRFSWRVYNGAARQHELALNPDCFVCRSDAEIISTLVHEQVHCWEEIHGTRPKRHYHNKIWAAKMIAIGLMPTSTGGVGGRITGVSMTHYILPHGAFAKAFSDLTASGWRLNLQSAPNPGREGGRTSKTPFACGQCGQKVWGKPSTDTFCGHCAAEALPTDLMAMLEPFRLQPQD
jgi:hypothetical protein